MDSRDHLKKSYHLENMRGLSYERLRNLLTTRIFRVAKRIFGAPNFHCYALASGIATLFSRLGRWNLTSNPASPSSPEVQPAWSFGDA